MPWRVRDRLSLLYVKVFFQGDTGPDCCGYNMKVRELQATAFSRGDAFFHQARRGGVPWAVWENMVHQQEVLHRAGRGGRDYNTHVLPLGRRSASFWIANKSGKFLTSTELLTDFSIAQRTMR